MTNVDVAPRAHWTARVRSFHAGDMIFNARPVRAVIAGAATITLGVAACGAAHAADAAAHAPRSIPAKAPAVGGPYEPAASSDISGGTQADAQYRSLFLTWKKLDSGEQAVIAVPSLQPIQGIGASQMLSFSSTFGVRSDPFRGTAAMHAGVDIPGPIGTPIYATADGVVDRAERSGGYGNLVELDHGKGIQTRYGHLSRILVEAGAHVKRGQLIALMGSTGRSTGSHLHYEVRLDGHAVNPMPFLQTADYLVAVQDRALKTQQVAAVGGPTAAD